MTDPWACMMHLPGLELVLLLHDCSDVTELPPLTQVQPLNVRVDRGPFGLGMLLCNT
jgi:hypothetical protein